MRRKGVKSLSMGELSDRGVGWRLEKRRSFHSRPLRELRSG